jgi:hypothetical protein
MLAKVTDSDPYTDLDLTPSDIKQYVLDYLQLATMFEGGITGFVIDKTDFYRLCRLLGFSLKFAKLQFSNKQKVVIIKKYDFFLLIIHLKYCLVSKSLYPTL